MGPDVDGFIVLLEERREVIAPGLLHRPVAGVDVGLPEDLRHLRAADSGRGEGGHQLRDLPHVNEEAAKLFGDDRCHDAAKLQDTAVQNHLWDGKKVLLWGLIVTLPKKKKKKQPKSTSRGRLNALSGFVFFFKDT